MVCLLSYYIDILSFDIAVFIDFRSLFSRLEGMGYTGHYTNGFGTLDDMIRGRDYLVAEAKAAGVPSAQ